MVIESAETYYASIPNELGQVWHGTRVAETAIHRHWHRRDVEPFVPQETADSSHALTVQVNEGRWIVQCPCGGAQFASRGDRRFFCVDCLNDWAKRAWVPVLWPDSADEIEAVLTERPDSRNRNWRAGETVKTLGHENDTHGSEIDGSKDAQGSWHRLVNRIAGSTKAGQ